MYGCRGGGCWDGLICFGGRIRDSSVVGSWVWSLGFTADSGYSGSRVSSSGLKVHRIGLEFTVYGFRAL